jgi:hypothetical protein
VLIDSSGRDVTTTIDLGTMHVRSGEELVVPIEFPADSFL